MNLSKFDAFVSAGNLPAHFQRLSWGSHAGHSRLHPCVKVCIVDGSRNLCIGCGRTLPEIAAWGRLDEERRRAIMAELPARLAAAKATAE
ncbi:MAG: DUF1289 domain-containing protein [Hyphomonadaceae bacterium]